MIARVVFHIVEVKFEDCQSSVYGTLLWQSSNFTSTIRKTTLAILKLYLNNTEHSSGNPQTLPQQRIARVVFRIVEVKFEDCQSSVPFC
jgi:hypothetical protein